ncbi:MAG: GYD domain protein [Acidobacteria bacterium]|nr:MAG: GYD domain protein [Acidobacteriota bacterium]
MPKYLLQGSYTSEGAKGLLKEGGSQRRAAVEKSLQPLGAKIEAFYYSLGEDDVYVIVDAPDNITVAAMSMAVNAAASVRLKTTVLLTTQEIDSAAKKGVDYRPPGR